MTIITQTITAQTNPLVSQTGLRIFKGGAAGILLSVLVTIVGIALIIFSSRHLPATADLGIGGTFMLLCGTIGIGCFGVVAGTHYSHWKKHRKEVRVLR